MSVDARVSALEDLLERVRRNSQLPRAPRAEAEAPIVASTNGVGHAAHDDGVLSLDTDALERDLRSTPPPPSARTLENLTLQRRGTPSRDFTARPPTPVPPMVTRHDSSPLHDAVISHTATSSRPGRIESDFGLVPPPPRRPSALPDFADEPTATGDPDEAEQLLLAEQEEAARAQRVRFPTPLPNRPPTPVPPPLTLREPPKAARPVLELDLDPASVAVPTRPFGHDPRADAERRRAAATRSNIEGAPLAAPELTLDDLELDGAKTDRPPAPPAGEEPPVSLPRLPNLEEIETAALSTASLAAIEEQEALAVAEERAREREEAGRAGSPMEEPTAGEADAPFEPLFDEASIETRTSRPPAPASDPPPPARLVLIEAQPEAAAPLDVDASAEPAEMRRPGATRIEPTVIDEETAHPSTIPPEAEASQAPEIAQPEAHAAAPTTSARVDAAPSEAGSAEQAAPSAPPPVPSPVAAPAEPPSERLEADEALIERSPSSSRQVRDEVRPVDDRFEGFGPVGDSEPPPQSGEVPSQRYGASEAIVEKAARRDDATDEPVHLAGREAGPGMFESPATEDEAPSRVVPRSSAAPERDGDRPSATPRRGTEPPVSDPTAGTPPKPARVDHVGSPLDLEGTPHPVDIDEIVRASYKEISGGGPEETTAEVRAIGRVDVVERTSTRASGPIAATKGTRVDTESFGAVLDASLAIGE